MKDRMWGVDLGIPWSSLPGGGTDGSEVVQGRGCRLCSGVWGLWGHISRDVLWDLGG